MLKKEKEKKGRAIDSFNKRKISCFQLCKKKLNYSNFIKHESSYTLY